MTPHYSDDHLTIYAGDCRAVMAGMEPESVQSVVTSPPYWGLRDYGVDGQLGLEPTPDAYVAAMVEVFREVRRVLRRDGTVWLNLGDSYAGSWGAQSRGNHTGDDKTTLNGHEGGLRLSGRQIEAHPHYPSGTGSLKHTPGLKPKDRVMIPARVALALQADGWWLRDEIVWHKPNPMPSSVEDRTTPAHEMVYLLTRSARYHYDAAVIRERASGPDNENNRFGQRLDVGLPAGQQPDRRRAGARQKVPGGWDVTQGEGGHGTVHRQGRTAATYREASLIGSVSDSTERQRVGINARWDDTEARRAAGQRRMLAHTLEARASGGSHDAPFGSGRNKRSVWTVATEPYPEAHFAAFPTALIAPMILAGTPPGGVVLDPFGGSGTVAVVAERLGRRSVLIDLSSDYVAQALRRISGGRAAGTGAASDLPIPYAPDGLWADPEAAS